MAKRSHTVAIFRDQFVTHPHRLTAGQAGEVGRAGGAGGQREILDLPVRGAPHASRIVARRVTPYELCTPQITKDGLSSVPVVLDDPLGVIILRRGVANFVSLSHQAGVLHL